MEEKGFWERLQEIYEAFVFVYGFVLLMIYGLFAMLSGSSIRKFLRKNSYVDYNEIIDSPLAPGISVIAPAFNEGVTIIGNVRSLLTLRYSKFEVIIVNDGSTDDTLEKLIKEFSLVKVDFAYNERIRTEPFRGVFKSTDPAFSNLVVVDKENGGSKADASNAGINASAYPYYLCTDVDCILAKDTLLKLIKPFLDKERRVIATGATLRIVNSCKIDQGELVEVIPPKKLLPRFQELEYVRSFVLGRMAWSRINGLLIVSGGLGLFDKEVAIRAGGYDHKSFAEDIDMITRMREYMYDNKLDHVVEYIPDSECWTEGPSTLKVYSRQRTRWGKGLIQYMFNHRKFFFNPRYGRAGLLTYPYFFFFEWLAPFIEFFGILLYIYLIATNKINWPYAIILIIFVYTFSIMISTIAVLWDQMTHRWYRSWKQVFGLCLMAFIEPILYHPLVVFFALRGNFFYVTRRRLKWGTMTRQGFEQNTANKSTTTIPSKPA